MPEFHMEYIDADHVRLTPMRGSAFVTPHRCPVCNGMKSVSHPPHVAGDVTTWGASGIEVFPCPACDATGVVWSSEETVLAAASERPGDPR